MPPRLNRKSYGWSWTYGRNQRTPTEEYKKRFDIIKWDDSPTDKEHGWEKGPVRPEFGRMMRKVYG